jgi:hypothetical protein
MILSAIGCAGLAGLWGAGFLKADPATGAVTGLPTLLLSMLFTATLGAAFVGGLVATAKEADERNARSQQG